ncbi:hypothetical protein scyTo_0018132, partial [Scyliorhinus torazame]|nr:hypothetical protein [Scyliorhinus torazame]
MDQIAGKSHESSSYEKPTVPWDIQLGRTLEKIEGVYYPLLAAVGVSFNLVAIVILSRG